MIQGKVISNEMKETEMGYRGSKSDWVGRSVKEQRADASSGLVIFINITLTVRCALVTGKPALRRN